MSLWVTYIAPELDQEALDAHGDEMMRALLVEPNLIDPDIGADLSRRSFDVCTAIEGDSVADALAGAITAVRSALHAIGACTAGWDEAMRLAMARVRPSELIEQ